MSVKAKAAGRTGHRKTDREALCSWRRFAICAPLILAACVSDAMAELNSREWSGLGATNNWSNPFNWVPFGLNVTGVPPTKAGDTSVYFVSSSANRYSIDLNEAWAILSLDFSVGEYFGVEKDKSFELFSSTGSTLTVFSSIKSTKSTADTISTPLALGDDQVWNGLNLLISGTRSGSFNLAINASRTGCDRIGPCEWTYAGIDGFVMLSGNGAAQTGNYDVYGGTLGITGGNAISDASKVVVHAGAVLDLFGSSERMGGLRGAGLVRIGFGSLETGAGGGALLADDEFSGSMTGTGTFAKSGTGLMRLTGDNSGFTGAVNVFGGTLEIGGAGPALSSASRVSVASGATLRTVGNAKEFGSLSGNGAVVLDTDTLVGANNANTTFSGVLSGAASFTKRGTGTLTLTGENSWTGAITIAAGVLESAAGRTFTDANRIDVQAGATLRVSGDAQRFGGLSGAGTVDLKRSITVGLNGEDTTFSGRINGTGDLDKRGSGKLTLSGITTFQGSVLVNGGTLEIGGSSDTLTNTQTVMVNSPAKLVIAGNGETFGGLSGAGAVSLVANMGVGADNGNTTFAGAMTGIGNFAKLGRGVMTLTGRSTLGGDAAISDGTLVLATGAGLSLAGTLVVGPPSTFEQQGGTLSAATIDASRGTFSFRGGELHVDTFIGHLKNEGGTLAPGHSPGTTTVIGDYTQGAAGVLDIEIGGASAYDRLLVQGGRATLDGRIALHLLDGFDPAVGAVFGFLAADSGITGAFSVFDAPIWNDKRFVLEGLDAQHLQLRVSAVPQPPTWALLASGLAAIMVPLLRRRRVREV